MGYFAMYVCFFVSSRFVVCFCFVFARVRDNKTNISTGTFRAYTREKKTLFKKIKSHKNSAMKFVECLCHHFFSSADLLSFLDISPLRYMCFIDR